MEHAHEHFDKARELWPNDNAIPGNYATWAIIQGDLDAAWQLARRAFMLSCPAPDRIMVRPLFCATVVLLLEGRDPSIPLGQLRRLFDMGINHVAWVVTALLERTDKDLSPEWSALLRAISAAVADKSELGVLKSLSRWQSLEPVGFDVPWPDRS
jgi:hypothetical protein